MPDTDALYQLEVKLPSENGESRTQVINIKSEAQLWYSIREAFPTTGNTCLLYIAIDEKKVYFWDGTSYIELSGSTAGAIDGFKEEYDNHVHTFVVSGKIAEEVIVEIETTSATINSVSEKGSLPQLTTSYDKNDKKLTLNWFVGELLETEEKEVISTLKTTKIQPSFTTESSTSSKPITEE